MTSRAYQFTLRGMFLATYYASVGFALAAAVLPIWRSVFERTDWPTALLGFSGPYVVGALMGAAIGELVGNIKNGVMTGLVCGGILWTAGILYLGITFMT